MIQLKPIGTIHNSIQEAHRDTRWEETESQITVDEEWREALEGVEAFSHLWIVTFFDRMPAPEALRIHPINDEHLPLVGIFASRSPQRPNRIGICVAELLEVRDNRLRVRGLDALDGTPVLDIKPYLPRRDVIEKTRVGAWVK